MSRVIAVRTRASRGCAARERRWSAVRKAASSGSELPVSCVCCCARRSADSMSTTRFSSRVRERLCIRSSSCVRCSATSDRRASSTAWRATASRAMSWAWRASALASIAFAPVSALCRASCSWIVDRRCHSIRLDRRAALASSASTSKVARETVAARTGPSVPAASGAAAGSAGASSGVGGGGWELIEPILSTRARRAAPGGQYAPRRSPGTAPPALSVGA